MGENEFKNLFNADEIAELQAVADELADEVAKQQPKKDGIWYSHDADDNVNGHSESYYAVNAGGKTVLWIAIDNDLSVDIGHQLPEGATAHMIRVWNATKTAFIDTKGFAFRYAHSDGTGTHVDGNTVRSYVMLRTGQLIAHFYGI